MAWFKRKARRRGVGGDGGFPYTGATCHGGELVDHGDHGASSGEGGGGFWSNLFGGGDGGGSDGGGGDSGGGGDGGGGD